MLLLILRATRLWCTFGGGAKNYYSYYAHSPNPATDKHHIYNLSFDSLTPNLSHRDDRSGRLERLDYLRNGSSANISLSASLFCRLHPRHKILRFSGLVGPPRAWGMTWSNSISLSGTFLWHARHT